MDQRRVAEQLRQAVLTASDRRHGLALEQLVVASCITKAPSGESASCAAAGRAALGKRAVRPSAARAGAAILGLDRSTGIRRGRSRP